MLTRPRVVVISSQILILQGSARALRTSLAGDELTIAELGPGDIYGLAFISPQVRPRSGLALKHAITLPNSPATIDPGYRGELKVILLNLGKSDYQIHAGDRIAQIVVARYEAVEWDEGELGESVRGAGGFGSSGR